MLPERRLIPEPERLFTNPERSPDPKPLTTEERDGVMFLSVSDESPERTPPRFAPVSCEKAEVRAPVCPDSTVVSVGERLFTKELRSLEARFVSAVATGPPFPARMLARASESPPSSPERSPDPKPLMTAESGTVDPLPFVSALNVLEGIVESRSESRGELMPSKSAGESALEVFNGNSPTMRDWSTGLSC